MEKAIKRYFPIFLLPTLIAFTIGFIVPFIMGIWLSFCEFTTVTDATFVGRELGDKAGVRRLAPGESETLSYTTEIFTIEKE